MWYTIILLSIALAVSVAFWIRADRMAGHYRREYEAEYDRSRMLSKNVSDTRAELEYTEEQVIHLHRNHLREREKLRADLATTRRQIAAARGQITKLRRKYGEIE